MRDYFCGWYFKCQSKAQTLALIPAIHRSSKNGSCSVQLITDEGAWSVSFPIEEFQAQRGRFRAEVGNSVFERRGIELHLNTPYLSAEGVVEFGDFSPIKYDIMGPFKYVPFMECRHSVLSMRHTVNGEMCINGLKYRFDNGSGYIEGDRGYSFPKEYAWTHCFFDGGSLMLSVADIPMGTFNFTGIIGIIKLGGKEYRIATYLGARIIKIGNGELIVAQGKSVFSARLIEKHTHPLLAPVSGSMERTIHESASCRAEYCFKQGESVLFSFECNNASFEYEYSR